MNAGMIRSNDASKILKWTKFDSFEDLIEKEVYREGVYIVWIETDVGPITRYVGKGQINNRIRDHSTKDWFTDYGSSIFCAETNHIERDGIEKYLSMELNPEIGERWPRAEPISVNIPFHN